MGDLMDAVTLLDGGMGQELINRGAPRSEELWSAWALLEDPGLVAAVHADYVAAGADVLTTNSYSTFNDRLGPLGLSGRAEDLTRLSGSLARAAADAAGGPVRVAGSLPPLRHSYNPEPDGTYAELHDEYLQMVGHLAEHVDLFVCETMGACFEARAAADAARTSGKPVWVSFTLQGGEGAGLIDGTSFSEACAVVDADAFLLNCCPPERIAHALPLLREATNLTIGAYANAFHQMPVGWRGRDGSPLPEARTDMGVDPYTRAVMQWVDMGAEVVGGCCEIGPGHIARIRQALDA
ncbi:MAG: homocysteine S-methyltransferase family protein [Acidimicrobiales bacterium]|jgi:S-methylmethionine-dependent homocysteine/selenocysteine methylase|nr:homocysteine S-methyltransferase family protein [Acidimicrobiales bacterium]HAZ17873.1 homocysteine S-methyltransferase family protein [Acidimicrobiaceae bacterium]HIE68133.1 homocysteine S-methyltransferase family protein [Acidimicrobiia bacterium]HIL48469.1 homocysteine S-methyltransferase family protein [Acidimicrobiia bacterium]|tara:strand:+ start:5123 stop:6007 length:885 start_codon:yes stop_codon:yes gene_type:complete